MYCLSCSKAVTPGLSYCKHCGAKLGGARGAGSIEASAVRPEALLVWITAVFVFGLGAIIGLMLALRYVFGPDNLGPIIAFTLLSFLIMLAVEGVFIGMLLGRRKGAQGAGDGERHEIQTPKDLSEAMAGILPEPVMSVTEHTTRTLEPVDRKRKTEWEADAQDARRV